MKFIKFLSISFILTLGFNSFSQEVDIDDRLNNSIRPIAEEDILYMTQLWRRMDMNEKMNRPFFANGHELSKFLIEWVNAGVIKAYKNDSLKTELSIADFKENLKIDIQNADAQLSESEKQAGFGGDEVNGQSGVDDGWGGGTSSESTSKPLAEDDGFNTSPVTASSEEFFFAKDLTIVELKEDAIIDRKRSRLYFDIQSITLIVPASKTVAGFDKPVASFRWKDVYNLMKANKNCIWYNMQNEMSHKNMSTAFDLRLFNARIIKKGNANDKFLTDIYKGESEGLLMSQLIENELIELEDTMWEN
ncbi:MAG: hypothetical protein RIR51_886 [Bacteroidota bacterium]